MKRYLVVTSLLAASLLTAADPASAKPVRYSTTWQSQDCTSVVATFTFTHVPRGAYMAVVRIVDGTNEYGRQTLAITKGMRSGSVTSLTGVDLVGTELVMGNGYLQNATGAVEATVTYTPALTCVP